MTGCPHGWALPPGACCLALARTDATELAPMSEVPPGADADAVYLVADDPRTLQRLSSFGLGPGSRVHVVQSAPAVVVRVGHTTIALERALAARIFVRRVPASHRIQEESHP